MDGKMKQWTSESCSSLKRCPISGNVLIQSLKRFKLSTRHYGFRSASPGSKHVDADPNFSRGAGGTERGLCQDWWDESHAFPILLCFFYQHVSEDKWVFGTLFTTDAWLMPTAGWLHACNDMMLCPVSYTIFFLFFFQMFTNQFP